MTAFAQRVDDGGLIVDRQHMPYATDAGIGHRAKIGLIVLAVDQTLEYEWRRMLTPLDGVAFYESRIPFPTAVTPETLAALEADIAGGAQVIRPDTEMDVFAFGCTSGAMVIGDDKVAAKIRSVRPSVPCTNPMAAAIAAFKALGARRIALLTPYVDTLNRMMRDYIEDRGIEVPVMGSYNEPDDTKVARISAETVRAGMLDLGRHPKVDAVFMSCTSIRVAELVEGLEAELGKPVTASNHAMAWHALRLAKVDDAVPGYGRLMQCPG
jgi:maleate isomerase